MKWVYRIASGVAFLVAAIVLIGKLMGVKHLPDCDDRETFDVVRKAIAGNVAPEQANGWSAEQLTAAVTLDDEAEVSYDKDKGVRQCTGTIGLTANGKVVYANLKVAYTVTWKNKDEGLFEVEVRSAGRMGGG